MAQLDYQKIIKKKGFVLIDFSDDQFINIKKEFFKLKDDKYLNSSKWIYRKRAFAEGIIKNRNLIWNKNNLFFQSKKINKFAGGISRKFPKLSELLKKNVEKFLIDKFSSRQMFKKKFKIGVHAIRIICKKNNRGFPVPEGFHTDGVDFVVIVPINSSNCVGGVSYLKSSKTKKIVLKKKLTKNMLLFNDRKLLHYATPISLKNGKLGFRDIIVFTFLRK